MPKKATRTARVYNEGHTRQVRTIEGPSMTRQSETKACDVNEIVKRFDRTGVITHLQSAQGVYADVSDIGSYSEAIQTVQDAQKAFYALPSGLRAHFDNDPAAYVDWATSATEDERNQLYDDITGTDRTRDPAPSPTDSPPADPPETGD